MIKQCCQDDFEAIYTIINDGAEAYRGVIPEDRWHEPYMLFLAASDNRQGKWCCKN